MGGTHVTIYTKECGKESLTRQEWDKYDIVDVSFHRIDGPAIKHKDGYEEWYIDGSLHRVGAPAVSCSRYRAWYQRGVRHRLDGYAILQSDGYGEYCIDGTYYSERHYLETINKYKSLPKSIRLTHELWWVREL